MPEKITLHGFTPDELKKMLKEVVQEEFEVMNEELQRVMGEDDMVSTGTACRLLGVCSKILKVLVDQKKITAFYHLKEKRYSRGQILEYRNKYRDRKRG